MRAGLRERLHGLDGGAMRAISRDFVCARRRDPAWLAAATTVRRAANRRADFE
ncbi:hypothetical protein MYA_4373 [Burkholderia sp. KJ006]|nr:hypothetical protein MYA_4373 [Burkholderia sp. KJ006]